MKVIENPPFKSTIADPGRPFWHKFPMAICEAIGVDPTKQDIEKIEITIEAGKLPRIVVTMGGYSTGQLQPIAECFLAADWKPKGSAMVEIRS